MSYTMNSRNVCSSSTGGYQYLFIILHAAFQRARKIFSCTKEKIVWNFCISFQWNYWNTSYLYLDYNYNKFLWIKGGAMVFIESIECRDLFVDSNQLNLAWRALLVAQTVVY